MFEIIELAAASQRIRKLEPLLGTELRPLSLDRALGVDPVVATVDAYGAPSYGPLHGKPAGVVFHTPENVDHTLAQAVAVARWQATTGNTSGGSYHGILGWDSARGPMSNPDAWVMVRSVPWNMAAGSLSSARDATWAPSRYSWIDAALHDAAYSNPNAWLHAISLSGKAAWWSSKLGTAAGIDEVRGALIAAARWVLVLERAYAYDALLTLHRHWQTTRSDPDGLGTADLIFDEYLKLTAAPTPAPDPLAIATARLAEKDRLYDAAGVAVRTLEATVAAGIEAIRAELRAGRNS